MNFHKNRCKEMNDSMLLLIISKDKIKILIKFASKISKEPRKNILILVFRIIFGVIIVKNNNNK